ncbi:hypothetical protein CDAR_35281 [Caerostris darwini]|uniref:Uncharacterized protein n=1 Tax=Caerostris darwini TaxID=1538125 RepID=A0AAV4SM16_9ARAC|nr:hypothetical protein CDAR_35281 [Caerostris darwini]
MANEGRLHARHKALSSLAKRQLAIDEGLRVGNLSIPQMEGRSLFPSSFPVTNRWPLSVAKEAEMLPCVYLDDSWPRSFG